MAWSYPDTSKAFTMKRLDLAYWYGLRVYFFSSDLLELEDSGRSTTPPVSSLS